MFEEKRLGPDNRHPINFPRKFSFREHDIGIFLVIVYIIEYVHTFMCSFYNSGKQVALALVEAIVTVVKATRSLCALHLPNSTLSCFPPGSCSPRLDKGFLYLFQKWHSQWWRTTKKHLCGLYFFVDRPFKGGDGQGWPLQLNSRYPHCYRATLHRPPFSPI